MWALILAATLISCDGLETPGVEASAFVNSSKVERGMTENRDPVYGWEAEVEWYGFHGGFESCCDMTDIDGRRGRYNELATRAGYERAVCPWCELAADYIYKHAAEGHTQELEAEGRFPCPWCVPFCRMNIDVDETPGALYGVFGVFRECEICQGLTATPVIGFGFGNSRRNEADFDCHRDAGRDFHAGVSLDWEIAPHVHLCPCVMLYDQFTDDARSALEHNGFICLAGCSVKASF